MKTHVLMHPRAEELLVERALRPLTAAEQAELAALGVDVDDDSIEIAAAAALVATTHVEPMPDEVLDRVAARIAGALDGPPVIPIDRARRRARWLVAIAAAAGIVIVIGLYARRGELAPADARAALIGDGSRALPWTATADTAAKSASGDVVWSDVKQRGYMRFVGLAVNDPTAWQYQLWIFDRTRDQAYPVDGGVFDVSSTGEVIVPISAKLHVDQATLFAVTVERPGGVVVSKRERIVVMAKPS